ncbi:MAG TPA: ferric reductase-like transmembrane domain-containing protein [Solirubrobacteraceae bacterium]|nr:ferric reductase-like transmembrane domain-containing protein [Solirubrobacteraceae bacterium]
MSTQIIATATGPHLFWITSRAAGITALLLSSVSVCLGLLMGGRMLRGRWGDMRVTHEALSLATLFAIAVHGLTLIGDGYLHPSLGDVAVPFLGAYKTFWTSTGIVAFWMMAILGLSYYARTRIGAQRWRRLHRFVALAWLLGVVHSLGEGTDAGQTWFLAMTAIAVLPALVLLAVRHLGRSSEKTPSTHTGQGAAEGAR